MTIFIGLVPPFLSTLQWGTWEENDTAKEMNVQLNISARIYQVYLTDSSMPGNSAINVTMCWDRDTTNYIVSSFTVKATNPPSSFSWLFIGKSS